MRTGLVVLACLVLGASPAAASSAGPRRYAGLTGDQARVLAAWVYRVDNSGFSMLGLSSPEIGSLRFAGLSRSRLSSGPAWVALYAEGSKPARKCARISVWVASKPGTRFEMPRQGSGGEWTTGSGWSWSATAGCRASG